MPLDRSAIIEAINTYNRDGAFPIARTDGGIYTRVPGSGDMWWMVIDLPIADLSSRSFTRVEQGMRARAHDYVEMLRSHVAGFEKAYLIQT